MTRVSIALATYNGARFLDEQLQSLAGQTLQPHEVIVSDDGSADDTLSRVRAFAKTAPFPVIVLEGEGRLGYRLNFRRAAQACTGDLIAFCDQDDVWRADKLAVMTRCFVDPQVLLAYHNATVFNGNSTRSLHSAAVEYGDLAQKPVPPFKSVNGLLQVFRAELREFDHLWDRSIDQNEGKVILAHDQWYFFLALLLGKVAFVDQCLLDYRQHDGNTYGVKTTETRLDRFAMRLRHFGDQDRWAAWSAESRADIAEEIGRLKDLPKMPATADVYRVFAGRLHRRAATYSASSLIGRTTSVARSISAGDYQGGAWRFEKASLIRDLWSGVIRGKGSDPTRA